MHNINLFTYSHSASKEKPCAVNSTITHQDIWFDALDCIEIEETWFDANESCDADWHKIHSQVSFTDDCLRGVQQFVRILAEYEESKLLSMILKNLFPAMTTRIIYAANSLYTAIIEKRQIDLAVLQVLGLATYFFSEKIDFFSQLTAVVRNICRYWIDETSLQASWNDTDPSRGKHLDIIFTIVILIAGRWVKNNHGPRRGILKLPAFMANIFIRASYYRHALESMVSNPLPLSDSSLIMTIERTQGMRHQRLIGDGCEALIARHSAKSIRSISYNVLSRPRLALSMVTSAVLAEGPVRNSRPLAVRDSHSIVKWQAYSRAGDNIPYPTKITHLLYCVSQRTATYWQRTFKRRNRVNLSYNDNKPAQQQPINAPDQTLRISYSSHSSAPHYPSANPLLPVMTASSVAPHLVSSLRSLKTKSVLALGSVSLITGVIVGGKILWHKFQSYRTVAVPDPRLSVFERTEVYGSKGLMARRRTINLNDDKTDEYRTALRVGTGKPQHAEFLLHKTAKRRSFADSTVEELTSFLCFDAWSSFSFADILGVIKHRLVEHASATTPGSRSENNRLEWAQRLDHRAVPEEYVDIKNVIDQVIGECTFLSLSAKKTVERKHYIMGTGSPSFGDKKNSIDDRDNPLYIPSVVSRKNRWRSDVNKKKIKYIQNISFKNNRQEIIYEQPSDIPQTIQRGNYTQYVANKIKNNTYLYYDQKTQHWLILPARTNVQYDRDITHLINQSKSSRYLSDISENELLYYSDLDMLLVITGKLKIAVIFYGYILNVEDVIIAHSQIDTIEYVVAVYCYQGKRKMLVHDAQHGWCLEKKSTAMSRELDLILAHLNKINIIYSLLSPVKNDGYVYDDLANRFIKHDYAYIEVHGKPFNKTIIKTRMFEYLLAREKGEFILYAIKSPGFPGYIVELNSMLFGRDTLYIADSLKWKIKNNGLAIDLRGLFVTCYDKNIFNDRNGNYFFLMDGLYYGIEFIEPTNKFYFSLQTKYVRSEVIYIYRLKYFYVESTPPESRREVRYTRMLGRMFRRSPVNHGSIKRTFLSQGAEESLSRIKTVAIDEMKLIAHDSLPNIFYGKNNKMYFKYHSQYFLATFSESNECLLQQTMIDIYKNKLFGKEVLLRLVYTKMNTEDNYISILKEQLTSNVKSLVEDSEYLYPSIAGAISLRREYFNAMDNALPPNTRLNELLESYFIEKEYVVFIHGKDRLGQQTSETHYPNIFEVAISYPHHIEYAAEILDKIMIDLSLMNINDKKNKLTDSQRIREAKYRNYLTNYFSKAFATHDDKFIQQVINRFKRVAILAKEFQRNSNKMRYENIWLVSSKGPVINVGSSQYKDFISQLTAAELVKLPAMVTFQDSVSHYQIDEKIAAIIVFAEKIHLVNPEHPQPSRRNTPLHMGESFLHEFTHAGAGTADYFYVPKTRTMRAKNFKDVIEYFDLALQQAYYTEEFTDTLQNYCTLYHVDFPIDISSFLNERPYLKSFFIMNNAATYESLFRDIAEMKDYDALPPYP